MHPCFRPNSLSVCAAFITIQLFLAPGFTLAAAISGTVTGPDARPVAGARVIASNPISVAAAVESDASGAFRLEPLSAGAYELRVVMEGFRSDPIAVSLAADEDHRVTIRLQISAVSESILVSASQVDAPLSRTADSVTVLTGADLRARQIESLADALRLVPGLAVARSGGRGGLTSIFPRGGESDFALVLVDGIRANAFGGAFDFSKLPAANIERVEVVRGPQSALYGSDAIGGVIQVVTRHDGPPRVDGLVEAGGLGTTHASIATSGSRRGWSWGGAAERLASDGFTGVAPATGERVANDDYRITQGSFSAGWRNSHRFEARGTSRLLSSERGFPGPFGSNPTGSYASVDRISRGSNDDRQLGFSLVFPWPRSGGRVRQRAQITHADLKSHFTSPYGESDSGTGRFSGRTQIDVVLGERGSVSSGIEYQRERATNTFITGQSSQLIPIMRDVTGYFGEVRHTGARLAATAGLRVEQIRRRALEGDSFGSRPAFAADSLVSPNPKATFAYFLRSPEDRGESGLAWMRVHASAGTGIRPPEAFEIAFTDNPNLKPERSRSLDFGVTQALARGAVSVDVTGFTNHFDDLIVSVGTSLRDASHYRTDNIANARTRGLELGLSARSSFGLDARFTYTLVDSSILAVDHAPTKAPTPFQVGDPLLRRPRHQASVDVALTRARFTAYAQAGGRGRTLDIEPSSGASGGLFDARGYSVVQGGMSYRLVAGTEIFARVFNLLDRQYEEILGYPAMGRTAMVGVRLAGRR